MRSIRKSRFLASQRRWRSLAALFLAFSLSAAGVAPSQALAAKTENLPVAAPPVATTPQPVALVQNPTPAPVGTQPAPFYQRAWCFSPDTSSLAIGKLDGGTLLFCKN
jgi:hypothetical protein